MAPPKSYMIPLQFPAGLYDYAKPPGPFAQWTSAPAYSYEEFARSNPRPKRGERKDRKSRAHRNGAPGAYDVWSWKSDEPWGPRRPVVDTVSVVRALSANEWLIRVEDIDGERMYRVEASSEEEALANFKKSQFPLIAHRNGAPEYYDVPQNAGPFWPDAYPYGAFGRPAAYGPSGYEAAEARAKPNGGKYASVLRQHGPKGFGLPENAPREGSFPLYPVKRARYAIAVVAAPAYDGHPEERERVLRAAVEAHPELKSMAEHALAKVVSRIGVRAAANGKRRK
jgi:hypothetical protein